MSAHDFDETWNAYIQSKQFAKLSQRTKEIYSNGIDTLVEHFGGKSLKAITRPSVIQFRDDLYDTPGKLRIALAVLNNILKLAYDRGWVPVNVAAGVGDLPPSKPIDRWQENEIDLFLQTAPVHLKDAMMLALYTGQRRSDLVRIRWADYDGNVIHVKQRKTGVELWIPVHPKLRTHLRGIKMRSGYYQPFSMGLILVSHLRQPWPPESLRCAFKRHCAKIGLEGKMLHGVRKTTASILAELGCTAHQIMAITGHQSLKEVQNYADGAQKKKLAQEAMAKWQQ